MWSKVSDAKVSLRWWLDTGALADAERRDGLYALVTNMSAGQCSPDRVLALDKDHALSKRAHHFLKGPLCRGGGARSSLAVIHEPLAHPASFMAIHDRTSAAMAAFLASRSSASATFRDRDVSPSPSRMPAGSSRAAP
jgi:hypothetical protein